MLIHEIRRRAEEAPVHEFKGRALQFKANAAGDVVCDVPDDIAQELLDTVGSAMVAYGGAPAKPVAAKKLEPVNTLEPEPSGDVTKTDADAGGSKEPAEVPGKFVLTSPDGEKFDLSTMDDAAVREFAAKAGLPKPHHTKKGDVLRQLVVDSLKAE